MTQLTPVLYVLGNDGEANGTIRYYCSTYCRMKAMQTNEDPVARGGEPDIDVLDGTLCEYCGMPVLAEDEIEQARR